MTLGFLLAPFYFLADTHASFCGPEWHAVPLISRGTVTLSLSFHGIDLSVSSLNTFIYSSLAQMTKGLPLTFQLLLEFV